MGRFGMCSVAVALTAAAMFIRSSEPNIAAVAPAVADPPVTSTLIPNLPTWEPQRMEFLERALRRVPWLHAWLYPNSTTWAVAQTPIPVYL